MAFLEQDGGDLLDIGHPEIYADNVAETLLIGTNIRFILFAWKLVDGVLRRCITGEVIRPTSSFTPTRLAELRIGATTPRMGSDRHAH